MCYNRDMNISQKFDTKKCPRCNFKTSKSANICPNCQLNYTKFDTATNEEAKRAISAGEHSRVVYRKGCPSDVSKVKLLLLTIFLGFMGAHLYYVGRRKRAIVYTVFFIIGLTYTLITTLLTITSYSFVLEIFYLLTLGWAVVIVMWFADIVHVIFNKFKIPVSLPY